MRIVKIPAAVDVGWANFHADKPLRVADDVAAMLVQGHGGIYQDEEAPKPPLRRKKKETAVSKPAENPEEEVSDDVSFIGGLKNRIGTQLRSGDNDP